MKPKFIYEITFDGCKLGLYESKELAIETAKKFYQTLEYQHESRNSLTHQIEVNRIELNVNSFFDQNFDVVWIMDHRLHETFYATS